MKKRKDLFIEYLYLSVVQMKEQLKRSMDMMRNFVKRCFGIIALVVAISLLMGCSKENSVFKRNECTIEMNFGGYGEIIGRYENRDIPRITIFEGEELGENEEIKEHLKEYISEITGEEVNKIIGYSYSFNENYENPKFDVNGYYSTRERAYSFTTEVEPTNNLFESIREDSKGSYIQISAEPLEHSNEDEWYAGTIEWCEEKASATNIAIKEKMIQYFELWEKIKPQEVIVCKYWGGFVEDYEIFLKFENQWLKAFMPINSAPFDEKEIKEIQQFTDIIHTEFLQSEYYAEFLREYGD